MKSTSQLKIGQDQWDKRPDHYNDEVIFRKLATTIVNKMQLDELHKLIKFTKIDPRSPQSYDALRDIDCPDWKRSQINALQQERVILFTAECVLSDQKVEP